jgi:hypothetical protein
VSDPEHSRLAPSAAAIWVNCPGSVLLQEQYPEAGTNEAREWGTAAHWLAASRMDPAWTSVPAAPNGVPVDHEMADAVTDYLDVVRGHGVEMFIERKVRMGSIHPDAFGTLDAHGFDHSRRVAYLDDFKGGFGLVEVVDNWQFVIYASGMMDLIGPGAHEWTFYITVVQPRGFHRDGPVRVWKTTGAEIARLARAARVAAEEASGSNPRTTPGPWCHHCTAKHACKALHAAGIQAAEASFDATPFDLPPEGIAFELTLLRRAEARIADRLASIEAQAMSEIRAGKVVPGWSIDHPPGREEWIKPVEEVLGLGALWGVSLSKPGAITPAQARKAGLPEEVVAPYRGRKSGKATLVPITPAAARAAFGNS